MKIPKEAKKVFEGVLFDVYQWKQKMFDNSINTFEIIERKPVVSVIGIVKGKIIILIQKQPRRPTYFSLVGGIIEEGETSIETAKRELLEETGYKSSDVKMIDESFGSSKIYFHEHIFVARNCKKISKPNFDSGEKGHTKFVSYDDFLKLCRKEDFVISFKLRFKMYESLIDNNKKEKFRKKLFGN